MKLFHMIAFGLVLVGGLNWLLVGFMGWDLDQLFGGQDMPVSRIIYVLVGLAAGYLAVTHKADCKQCAGGMSMGASKSA